MPVPVEELVESKPLTLVSLGVLLAGLGVIVLAFTWNAFALQYLPDGNTVSDTIVYWSKKQPLVIFLLGLIIGILAGHWWPVRGQ